MNPPTTCYSCNQPLPINKPPDKQSCTYNDCTDCNLHYQTIKNAGEIFIRKEMEIVDNCYRTIIEWRHMDTFGILHVIHYKAGIKTILPLNTPYTIDKKQLNTILTFS